MKDLLFKLGNKLYLWSTTGGSRTLIVSYYNNYEWITTCNCRSLLLVKLALLMQGEKLQLSLFNWKKIFKESNVKEIIHYIAMGFKFDSYSFEWYDPNDDTQVLHHTPYGDMY